MAKSCCNDRCKTRCEVAQEHPEKPEAELEMKVKLRPQNALVSAEHLKVFLRERNRLNPQKAVASDHGSSALLAGLEAVNLKLS